VIFHATRNFSAMRFPARKNAIRFASLIVPYIFVVMVAGTLAPSILRAQQVEGYKDARVEAAKILARTMFNPEFRTKSFRGGEWLGNGDYYLAIENSAGTPGGTDIVRYATSTGARDIFIAASKMIPAGAKTPLTVESYKISPDGKRILILQTQRRCGARTLAAIIGCWISLPTN